MEKRGIRWRVLIPILMIIYIVIVAGSLFTYPNTNLDKEWYDSVKPSITPPNWVFPIVWNILFFLIALSLYFSWINAGDIKIKKKIALVFGFNFLLNVLWSIFFFGMQNPLLAFYDLILLWISILIMIKSTWSINKKSSLLLLPYLIWVSFAGILNWIIAFRVS